LKWQYSEHFDGKKGKRKANNYCNKEPIKGLTMSGAGREEKFFNYKFKFKNI